MVERYTHLLAIVQREYLKTVTSFTFTDFSLLLYHPILIFTYSDRLWVGFKDKFIVIFTLHMEKRIFRLRELTDQFRSHLVGASGSNFSAHSTRAQ